jgi:hypothetical protein
MHDHPPTAVQFPQQAEIEGDSLDAPDMKDATSRAREIFGAMSILDYVAITPAEFWAVYNESEYAQKWIKTTSAKLVAIAQEAPREGLQA